MLAFRVRYLTGRVYATDATDRNRVEWPPHPERFFSALVAAAFRADIPRAREALEWLEAQEPPHIAAPPLAGERRVHAYVPVNDVDGMDVLPLHRPKQPRPFPSGTITGDATVHFVWPAAHPPASVRECLAEIAAQVTYLGSSMSLVAVDMVEDAPPPNYVPHPQGDVVLRVPFRGRLAELDHRFRLGERPVPGRRIRYRRLDDNPRLPETARSVFGEFFPFRIRGRWPLAAALTLTATVRAAVLSLADEPVPSILHGHDDRVHCAYVPLPFVGADHADGSVLGFAVVLPRGVSWPERQAVFRALGKLRCLELPGGRVLEAKPVNAFATARTPSTLTPWRWCRPARVWASVTPVVFDRFPRRRHRAAEVLADSCRFVGLPAPRQVTVSQASPLRGVPRSRDFRVRRQPDEPLRYVAHVILEFDQPVEGPVLLGSGRYFGLGFFAPVVTAEEATQA
ncbi:type I-U CRISPR-associated protein Csb2 [Thermaerobacter composti]|uniref:Type I-U CRISPR-associated protein Csb2 n=1 Tax=Thermaerobacter composti TaxID=554949 RepID=A0ABZ0QQN2_9FIRM|nr:type I-U CRISPR-associated protein Csb2 [Thermaerobacter composti]WPD19813.1 type I-U CRISPR-associated protein Csb2 [Thermaerobacter composti]